VRPFLFPVRSTSKLNSSFQAPPTKRRFFYSVLKIELRDKNFAFGNKKGEGRFGLHNGIKTDVIAKNFRYAFKAATS